MRKDSKERLTYRLAECARYAFRNGVVIQLLSLSDMQASSLAPNAPGPERAVLPLVEVARYPPLLRRPCPYQQLRTYMTTTSTDRPAPIDEATPEAEPATSHRWFGRAAMGRWIESPPVQNVIIAVIVLNAATLGFETSDAVMGRYGDALHLLDKICLAIFVAELGIKLYAFRLAFFRTSWNVFDLLVVGIALIPGSGAFGVLRSLRVLRVLRLISMVPQLRRVVEALVKAVPGILSIGALLLLLFYVCGVMATMLFKDTFPEEFGNLSASLFSLFQIMTLDNWSGIARGMLDVHPWAPVFFVPYILLSAFTVLNLFIAVIVDAMQHLRSDADAAAEPTGDPAEPEPPAAAAPSSIDGEIRALRQQLSELTELVRSRS
ncbi:ion transporter [Pseudactinotalea terrae]|uniref:ion transporter n=1 Tax=Pseudactinotalea terrae TaxID=1743262 RepID=UPI0019D65FF1|nr:ion transporter [Pseudactinotalea terrae]